MPCLGPMTLLLLSSRLGVVSGERCVSSVDVASDNVIMSYAYGPSDRVRYARDRRWLDGAVHELPAAVLWGAHGATPGQCAEMLDGLDEFARICDRLELDDHEDFIEGCRWHFGHYPHYLGRRYHFVDYATYIRDRRGPQRVLPPPDPAWLRSL